MVLETGMSGDEPFIHGFTGVRVPVWGFSTDAYDVRLIRRDGKFLPGRFDRASGFAEGRAVVSRGDRSYVIDTNGSPLIEADASYPANPSWTAHHVSNVRYGYMNRSGQICIPAQYANAGPFTEGLAPVKWSRDLNTNDWGYISIHGATVIAPRFKGAGAFSNGLAYAEWVTQEGYLVGGIINTNGRVVVNQPCLAEWSHALFGVPSLEQHRIRTSMIIHEGLIPRLDGFARTYVDVSNRVAIPQGGILQRRFGRDGAGSAIQAKTSAQKRGIRIRRAGNRCSSREKRPSLGPQIR